MKTTLVFLVTVTFWMNLCFSAIAADDSLLKRFDKDGDGKISDSGRQVVGEKLRQMRTQPGAMTPSGKTATIGNREVSEMQYASSDGRKIPCVLSMPKGDGPFPCVVTIHGGQGDRALGYLRTMAAPNNLSPTVAALNEQPWAVLAISYRSGGLFGLEEDDVVAGIRFAKTLPKINPSRIGVLGGSHGGHLALRAAQLMGNEFLCVAVGSPWMTDPFVYMTGKEDEPPLSEIPAEARKGIMENGRRLYNGLRRRAGSDAETRRIMREHSIEANAERIVIPSLFVTSLGDDQVPHLLVKPTIDRLKAAGRDVTVFTATSSPHGFYWARTVSAARALRGEKTDVDLAEEKVAREAIIAFFTKQFARTDVKSIDSPNVDAAPSAILPPPRSTPPSGGDASMTRDISAPEEFRTFFQSAAQPASAQLTEKP
jgi:dienelactone hydrolase